MEEIFEDITTKLWGVEGSGKPEILRHGRYKGAILDESITKNRLVYRVLDNHSVQIEACERSHDDK